MIGFEAAGVRVSFDFTFFAALGIFFAFDQSGCGIFCLLACLCHESAHLAVLTAEKNPPKEIIFSGGGICIKQRREPSDLALWAGCAVNLLLFCIFYLTAGRKNIYPIFFGVANLCVGAINLLPIGELDGKKLLARLLQRLFLPHLAEKIGFVVEVLFTAAAAAAILVMIAENFNLTAVVILLYIFLVNFLQKKG